MRVYELEVFSKALSKALSSEQIRRFRKYQKTITPTAGKPLGPVWFRELKFGGKRVYFVTQEDVVLFLSASNKKSQQAVIDVLRSELEVFSALLDQLIR